MQEIIRKAGFSQVEFKRLTMGTCFCSPNKVLRPLCLL